MRTDSCTRGLVVSCLLAGALSILIILNYTGHPHPLDRFWIFEYNLRTQDLTGSGLLMALVLAACFAPGRRAGLALVDAMSRHPWRTAGLTFVVLCLGTLYVEHNHPLVPDEYAPLLQSRVFAAGHLTGQFPPELMGRLIPPNFMNHFLYGSFQTGQVASAYWPGFALLLTPFSFLQVPWACNPLLACLALVLIGRLAVRLTGEAQAAGWAMLLTLASPGFTAMAITYFSMTAHLLINLIFVWLLLEKTPRRLVLAGLTGSVALILHNPVPHALFALPWIVWLALQPAPYRSLRALATGYAPLALIVGFGWAFVLSGIQGNSLYGLFPFDGNPLHRIGNFFWDWHIRIRSAIAIPDDDPLGARIAETVRLWNWAVPGLPLLAAAGWWLGRRDPRLLLLGLSLACTAAGYSFVAFTQGFGWGARYFHPPWGALPILAAVALVSLRPGHVCERLRTYVASLAVLSLVFATALRAVQIHDEVAMHLANRPPVLPEGRQIVFIAFDKAGYSDTLVQNDLLLRDKVWFMVSLGPERDAELMRARFPGARLVHSDRRGGVWRLE
jgi:hypothetical protein